MVNTAYSIDSSNPIESFLTAKKNYIPNVTETIYIDTPKDLASAKKYYEDGIFNGAAFQHLELYDTVNENDLYESFEYARYWHGYLVYLRPLLVIFNYEEITVLSLVIFGGLLCITSFFIWKKIGKFPAIALILACLCSDIFFITGSINEILCFDLAFIFSIYLLLKKDSSKLLSEFFIFGSITNFFDFLTNPIVTYGIPIVIYFMIIFRENKKSFKDVFLFYLKSSILWIMGYALTWISKWIITDVLLNRGIISNAIQQIRFRTNINNISKGEFFKLLGEYLSNGIFLINITFLGLFLITFIDKKRNKLDEQVCSKKVCILAYFIALFIPFVWFIVVLQHSYVHIFFTYRNIIVYIFSMEIFILEITNSIYNTKS